MAGKVTDLKSWAAKKAGGNVAPGPRSSTPEGDRPEFEVNRGPIPYELDIELDGRVVRTAHRSREDAKRALATHLKKHGGTGKAVMARKGWIDKFGMKPIPAKL